MVASVLKGHVFGKCKDIIALLAKLFPREPRYGLSYGNPVGFRP